MVGGLDSKTEAELIFENPIADVMIPNNSLGEITAMGSGELTIQITKNADESITADIALSGRTLTLLKNPITICTEAKITPISGDVAVLKDRFGVENIIEKSLVVDGQLYLQLIGSGTFKIISNAGNFDDMYYEDGVAHWSKPYVDFASARNLVNGMGVDENGRNNFEPEIETTRGMLVTILNRLEDAPKAVAENSYSDIIYDPAAYFENSVIWASENNIVQGMGVDENGNNNFEPLLAITRQQLAVMLCNYVKYLGIDTSKGNANAITSYNDSGDIAIWATDSMIWAVDNGILSGKPGNILDPNAKATRCEVTAVLQRLVKNLIEK